MTYDTNAGADVFDITNGTGASAAGLGFPITTQLTFTVTDLVVDISSGSPVTLTASDFTTDAAGDELCANSACNLSADNVTEAILTGTLSPTTGLAGIGSDTGITGVMNDATPDTSVTLLPAGVGVCGSAYVTASCDGTIIYATGTTGVTSTPEPGTWALLGIGMIGLLMIGRRRLRGAGNGRLSTAAGY